MCDGSMTIDRRCDQEDSIYKDIWTSSTCVAAPIYQGARGEWQIPDTCSASAVNNNAGIIRANGYEWVSQRYTTVKAFE